MNTGTKVNAATQACQATIATFGATYANKAAAAMNACLDAIVKCDEQATEAKALACRRGLLVPTSGKCAVGKVDEGASMLGNGAALHADSLPLSKAVLLSKMRTYSTAIQKKCFDVAGVDLGSLSIGLGFSPTPGTRLALADATNQDPGGIQCLANGLVLETRPLANNMTAIVRSLNGTCAVSKDLTKLGMACTVDANCDGTVAASGRCGALAKVFLDDIKPCATPPVAVCGNGTPEAPEQCDDGNLVNGDGCSSTCTIEGSLPRVCGDGLAVTPEQCDDHNLVNGDGCSSTCTLESAHQLLSTGQTTCWNAAGAVISCGGTGQDGDLQKGALLAYVDNGDGTITDTKTGLMWEKLSDDGTIHDWNNFYTWANAFAVKIAALNGGGGFAGHTDWRVPNFKELVSILNLETGWPQVSAAFNTGCVPGATVLTGSCTQTDYYWSSSTASSTPSFAWYLPFYDVFGGSSDMKTAIHYVRAVRGGL